MLKKIRLEPLMSNGDDIEVVHWVNINEQLKNIAAQVKDIAVELVQLRRQDDLSKAERENLLYRVTQLEKKPQEDRQRWTFYTLFGGCAYMVINLAVMIAIAGLTIYFAHH